MEVTMKEVEVEAEVEVEETDITKRGGRWINRRSPAINTSWYAPLITGTLSKAHNRNPSNAAFNESTQTDNLGGLGGGVSTLAISEKLACWVAFRPNVSDHQSTLNAADRQWPQRPGLTSSWIMNLQTVGTKHSDYQHSVRYSGLIH
ncbi:hypothetical protein ACO22_02220 [Paracoccidioides brasiliensis]|uniref:Uncharacterized protein n=1 Tax=Paracoccidioides brasiliensis TaxID=121759 RepID=A0A1D2JJ86_PARBR|nr:hypothetical protein ACO22_02220 [Paracoccidioides brasiliensis]